MHKLEKDLKGLQLRFWKTYMAEQFFKVLFCCLKRLIRRLGNTFVCNEAGICLKFLRE